MGTGPRMECSGPVHPALGVSFLWLCIGKWSMLAPHFLQCFFFLSYLFYLAALGLSYGMWDLVP